jgi:pyruvate/2-oxoglutarate dehydrogenase complex dihydrolipoamide acyltransferase (E2) component
MPTGPGPFPGFRQFRIQGTLRTAPPGFRYNGRECPGEGHGKRGETLMKRFVTWVAVALLVAVAISRWRRMQESPGRQVPSGGREKPVPAGPATRPAGGTGDATQRADEAADQADGPESGVEATPAAERRAEELGVDLSQVRGTGSGGRITVKDVQSAAKKR